MSEQITKDLGGITAYAAAVAAGYTGTKSQFETLMASYATVAQNAAASATAANGSAEDAEAFADGQRDGVDVGSDDPAYHNNAKYYAELAEDYAGSIDPDKIESHIDAAYIKETASGSIATFSDGAPAPVRSLVADIVPLQSGSGDPSPDNVRAISGWTEANISVTGVNVWDEDWQAEGSTQIRSKRFPVKPGTTYYLKSPVACVFYKFKDKTSANIGSISVAKNTTFTVPADTKYLMLYTDVTYGTTYNHDISINYPSTDHDYHAYDGEVHPISFASAGTVYGGSIDVTTGVLTVDRGSILLDGSQSNLAVTVLTTITQVSWLDYVNIGIGDAVFISDKLKYTNYSADGVGSIWTSGVPRMFMSLPLTVTSLEEAQAYFSANPTRVVYPLATPQTYQLTPTEVKTLLKNNNIWADTGNVTVEYVADTKTFIEELINA